MSLPGKLTYQIKPKHKINSSLNCDCLVLVRFRQNNVTSNLNVWLYRTSCPVKIFPCLFSLLLPSHRCFMSHCVCVCVRHACNNNRSEICLLISRQLHWASRECCCHHNWYSDDKVENAGDTWLLLLSLLGSSHRGIWMQPTNEMRPRWYSRLLLALWDLFQSTVFLSVTSCF